METDPASILESHLGYWLRRVSNHVSGEFKRRLQARNTSVAEWVVLCQIKERPDVTPGKLAATLGLTRGAISKVIDKLEAKAWIAGSSTPKDSRVRLLALTPAGVEAWPALRQIADGNDQEFFGVLTEDERAALRRLLAQLIERHKIDAVPTE